MSRISTGLIGAVAILLALDAVSMNIASGRDRGSPAQPFAAAVLTVWPAQAIERAGKSDRLPTTRTADNTTRTTVVFELNGMPATSIAAHVMSPAPARSEQSRNEPSSQNVRHPIACEGVVSVLTDVARQLAPGRCVT